MAALASIVLLAALAQDPAASFAGVYYGEGDRYLELVETGGGVFGLYLDASTSYSVRAGLDSGALSGTATAPSGPQDLRASWDGERLALTVGGTYFELQRVAPAAVVNWDFGAPRPDPEREWTIACFMGSDNDLELSALLDLEEMQEGMPEKGVELLLVMDRAEGHWSDEPLDWTDSAVFRLRPGARELLLEPGELDMTSALTLAEFLAATFRAYPARHYAVFFWDHGNGWDGMIVDEDIPGHQGPMLMGIDALRMGLLAGMVRGGVPRIDLVAFDACLMAHLETALGLADLVDMMVASQAVVAGTGFPYRDVLPLFAEDRLVPDLAAGMVAAYGDFYDAAGDVASTLSAIDLSQAAPLAAEVEELAEALLAGAEEHWPALARALFYAENYESRVERTLPAAKASIDLLDVVRRLRRGASFSPRAELSLSLERALEDAVLVGYEGVDRRLSHGLSIYGPHHAGQMRPDYAFHWFGRTSRWRELLETVHAAAARDTTPIAIEDLRVLGFSGAPAEQVRPFDGCRVQARVTGKGIVQVQQWDSVREDGEWLVLRKNFVSDAGFLARLQQAAADEADLVMPQYVDGANALSSELTGMHFAVFNGEWQVNGTVDMAAPSTTAPFVVRAGLREPGQEEVEVAIEFDRVFWLVQSVRSLEPGQVEPRALQPSAQAQLRVRFETIADDGRRGTGYGEPIAWSSGLRLILSKDSPGTYRADWIAQTMAGREYSAAVQYELAANEDFARWEQSWHAYRPQDMSGTWDHSQLVGPDQFAATGREVQIVGPHPLGPGAFRVQAQVDGRVVEQIWVLELLGVPNLRVVTPIEGQRFLCWYGPAALGDAEGRPFVAMKAVNVAGMIWRWERRDSGSK